MSEILSSELNLWRLIVPKCENVFDVGCGNDNDFYEINPRLKEIHLFDPNVSDVLLSKIKDKNNIFFNNFALGNSNDEKQFYYNYKSFKENITYTPFKHLQQKKTVTIKKLSDYVREKNITHIDYLKIDAEGFEMEIIKGCDDFINNIKYVQFEDFHIFYNNETVIDIFNFFKEKGWNIYFIGGVPDNYVATKETLTTLKEV